LAKAGLGTYPPIQAAEFSERVDMAETAARNRITGVTALAVLADLGGASIAGGAIARRRAVVGLLERMQTDRRAVNRMRQLRRTYGSGPVELVLPGRRIIVPLDPSDVGRVLDGAPTPFDPASWEKRRALEQFQPHAVLITRGPLRGPRRTLNEGALDTQADLHRLAAPFADIISEEIAALTADALNRGTLNSAQFTKVWWRLVRRVVLGNAARDDDAVTDDLWRLRRAGNWSFAAPVHARRRARFLQRLHDYAEHADPDSLLGALTSINAAADLDPIGQVPHWLFAFDAAGMAAVRAAALLATHPETQSHWEITDPDIPQTRPYLRASVLESVRLWPTTPALLRETVEDTGWGDADQRFTLGSGATVFICVPAFHRDPDTLPFADQFVPEIWLDGSAQSYPQLVPFSAGPAECPGRNLVLFVTSSMLAKLFDLVQVSLQSEPPLSAGTPLPLTLNQFGLTFAITPKTVGTRA
jgi:cytochrome P450